MQKVHNLARLAYLCMYLSFSKFNPYKTTSKLAGILDIG